ncbi:MAG: glycosyltransferase family 39 protein [Candidatus Eiseniibacteriota bacterium]
MAELRPRERALVAALLIVFALLAALSVRGKNPTFDETAHLASGISYVQLRDWRLNPEHPALPKEIAGLAASATGIRAHDDTPAWERGEQWDYARELLYERGVDWRRILFAGRLPMIGIGVLLGFVLWAWARAMLGTTAAAVALALFAFSPSFLAHAPLVTTDVPLALTVTGAGACLWRSWRTGRMGWTIAAAGCVALSMLTKFSAFSFAPAWALLVVLPSAARPWRSGVRHLAVFAAAAFVLTEFLVFVCYGFAMDWATIRSLGMEGRGVTPESMSLMRRIPYEIMASVPWPSKDFAEGMKTIILYTEAGHPVYVMGRRAEAGTWWLPFVTLVLKATVPAMLLAAAALVAVVRDRTLRGTEMLFVLVPAALVLLTNAGAKLGLGVRHLLPAVPSLILFTVWPFRSAWRGPAALVALVVPLGWHAAGTLRAFPHYLPWFNEIAGGTEGGARWLGDSNLDWGQDLTLAAERLRARGVTGAVLCYFGTASPFAEEMDWQVLPPTQRARNLDPWKVLPVEGEQWLAMSRTNLQGIYYRADGGEEPYPWLAEVEPVEIVGGSILLYEIGALADVQWGMAGVYRRHGLLAEEEAALRRALAARKYLTEARMRLTEILLARGAKEEAAELILQCPNPEVSEILLVARLHEEMGKLDFAEVLLSRGIKGFPGDAELKNQLAWFLQKYGGDLDLALTRANEAVQWAPRDPYFRDTRAMVHLRRGDLRAAMADIDTTLSLPDGDLAAVHWHRALVLDAMGRRREAEDAANEALAREGVDDELINEIGEWFGGR